jgi:hypothetical protein
VLEKWAGVHCTSSARSTIIESSEDTTVIIGADKCDHIGHDGAEVLGPLQTKGGAVLTGTGPMAGLAMFDQKNVIAVAIIIFTAFKICISHRKNGLLNRPCTQVSFSTF